MIGENIMDYNNIYNFKNPIRHFINIDNIIFPTSPASIDIDDTCWTKPRDRFKFCVNSKN